MIFENLSVGPFDNSVYNTHEPVYFLGHREIGFCTFLLGFGKLWLLNDARIHKALSKGEESLILEEMLKCLMSEAVPSAINNAQARL